MQPIPWGCVETVVRNSEEFWSLDSISLRTLPSFPLHKKSLKISHLQVWHRKLKY